MASNYVEWYIQLIDGRKSGGGASVPIDDDTGVYNVLTADDPAEITIYSDDKGTSGSNPGTMSNGIIQFWTDVSTTSVDISVLTANGHAFFLEGLSRSDGRVVVYPERLEQLLIMPYKVVGASETVVDTGFDISAKMLVKDVWLHTTTLGTGTVLDIGTSTDTDGFLDGVTVDATGYLAAAVFEENPGSAHQLGALLASTTAKNVRKLHIRANATSGANIVYINTTVSSTAGAGYIYMKYDRIPT